MGDTTLSLATNTISSIRAFGAAVFATGFGMEVMADTQLELHRQERSDLCRHGVWGLVRHPKYVLDMNYICIRPDEIC